MVSSGFANLAAESRIALAILFCLFVAPYTKVEESFNIQAIHDILTYGIRTPIGAWLKDHYDHSDFPGAVPRTFVGALLLAGATKPFTYLLDTQWQQVAVRAVLGLFNAFCIARYSRAVRRAFGDDAGTAYLALQACQFHIMYYASRTLPNFMAFGFATLALADLLPIVSNRLDTVTVTRRYQRGLVILTIIGVVFRSEIAALLAVHTVNLLYRRRLKMIQIIQAGAAGLVAGLLLTVPIDSLFWQRTIWPELNAFIFNVIEGKSKEWGTSPFYHYFLVALPKLLLNPAAYLICIPVALYTDASRRTWDLLLPNYAYVAIMSIQAHKEWRFIIYVLPPLTAVAAVGADQLWKTRAKSSKVQQLMLVAVLLSVPLTMMGGFAFLVISSLNYPGAAALHRFHAISNSTENGTVRVHMDGLTCMTGVTRFLQVPPRLDDRAKPAWVSSEIVWMYDKEEDPDTLLDVKFWEDFDYVITETPERVIGAWKIVEDFGTVTGYSGFQLTKSITDIQLQHTYAGLAGEPTGDISDLGRKLLVRWNRLGLSLSRITAGRWLTIRMAPKLYILKHTRGAL